MRGLLRGIGTALCVAVVCAGSATAADTRVGLEGPSAVKAFDTTATITDPDWFRGAYRRGFRLYVLHTTVWGSCRPWPRAQEQIRLALAAGLRVAAYTRDPRCYREGIAAVGPYRRQLQFFALDIETDPGVRISARMVAGVARLGVRPMVYTGSGMWPALMGSRNDAFSRLPLWDTDVGRETDANRWKANLLTPAPVAYAGWNRPASLRRIVQQAFDVRLDGVRVDLDSVDSTFLR